MPTHNNQPATDTQWLFTPPGQPVPPPEREIVYNRANRDYDMPLAGEYVGSRESYHAAEVALDNLVYATLTHTPDPEDNHRCSDCGAALNDYGQCEDCQINNIHRSRRCASCERTEHETVFSLTLLLDEGKLILCDACYHKAYAAEIGDCVGCGDRLPEGCASPWCRTCTEAGEAEIAAALAEPVDPETMAAVERARVRVLNEVAARMKLVESGRSCPSCEAPTPTPGICAACRVEATALLHSDELTMPQYVELAVAGAG